MDRPKRKCSMVRNDESNSTPTSKRTRQNKTNESPSIADGSNISTGQSGKKTSTSPRSIENLPSELLIKIIELLPVAQWSPLERVHPKIRDEVYKAWGSLKKIDIQRDLLPRQQVKLDGEKKFQDKRIAIVEKLCQRAPNLIDIAVGSSKIETSRGLRFIMAQLVEFKKLQRIDFGEDCLTTSNLSRFLRESASRDQLKEIVNVDGAIDLKYFDNDHLFDAFDNSNNNDKHLRLETMDFEPRNVTYKRIRWNFFAMVDVSRLTTFRVMDTDIGQRLLADFLDRTPQLRQLSFDFSCRYSHYDNLHQPAADGIETVLGANKRIISAIVRMDGLESLIMGSRIKTSRCSCGNFDHQLKELLITLGQRQSFRELGVVNQLAKRAFMVSIALAIPKVESLQLDISDLGFLSLGAIFLPLSNLRKLHVAASFGSVGADMFDIGCIMQNAPTLESLILDLPSKTFYGGRLKAMGGLTELRALKMDCVGSFMNDAVLEAWADGFGGNLTELEISDHGPFVTDEGLVKLIEKSPNLKTFQAESYCFTDGGLKKMAALSPRIETLGFDCWRVTKIGLKHVINGFRHLKKLDLKVLDSNCEKNLKLNFGKYRVVNLYESYDDEAV